MDFTLSRALEKSSKIMSVYMFSHNGMPCKVFYEHDELGIARSLLSEAMLKVVQDTLKDLNSTVAKRGSVFIGLMTPDGAIWFRYQRAVLMR